MERWRQIILKILKANGRKSSSHPYDHDLITAYGQFCDTHHGITIEQALDQGLIDEDIAFYLMTARVLAGEIGGGRRRMNRNKKKKQTGRQRHRNRQ